MRLDRRAFLAVTVGALLLVSSFPRQTLGKVAGAKKRDDGPIVARVTVRSQTELERLVSLELDLLETREGDDLFVLTTPEQLRQLRKQGWLIKVDKQQTALLRRQRPDLKSTRAKTDQQATISTAAGGYLTVPEMRAFLDERAAQHPDLAEVFVYGSSWERLNRGPEFGHELFGIRLTNRQRPGPKPTFFLLAAIHARELSTSELALRFVDHLLAGYGTDADLTWLLDEHLVVVIPVLNPDGRRLAEQGVYQRKNMNDTVGGCTEPITMFKQPGVDLNRNHDFKWGTVNAPTVDPCTESYPGAFAASEPETSGLQDLVRSLIPDQRGPLDTDAAAPDTTGILITLHSYGELVMWPWGHTSSPPPNGAELSLIGQKFSGYNGHTPQQANKLYPSSGKTDEWGYGELGIASYVFEVGRTDGECGGFMPPYSCLDGGDGGSFWPRNLPTFIYAARIARAPYQLAQGPAPESLAAIPSADAGVFEVRAQFDERLNGGQRIAAAEYYVDAPPWRGGTPVPMAAADGNFDGTVEIATASVGPLDGPHTVYVRAQDEQGNWGPVRAAFKPADSCASTIAPTDQTVAPSGGAFTVNVTGGSSCGWAASVGDGAGWITITSPSFGTGSGAVSFKVAPNDSIFSRTATLAVAGQTFTVTQGALLLNTFTFSPATIKGGQSTVGTLTFIGTAPEGGAAVSVLSSNPAAAPVPSTVIVPAGADRYALNVTTQAVAANTSVSISVTYGSVTRTASFTITPAVLAPTGLTATGGVGRIDLKWADKSANETGFRIERCTGIGCTNFAQIATVGARVTTYRNSGLLARTSYSYRVRAYNADGNSVYTNVATAKTK